MGITVEDKDVPERLAIIREGLRRMATMLHRQGIASFLSVTMDNIVLHVARGALDDLVEIQLNAGEYLAKKMKKEMGERECDGDCGACQEKEKEKGGETLQ